MRLALVWTALLGLCGCAGELRTRPIAAGAAEASADGDQQPGEDGDAPLFPGSPAEGDASRLQNLLQVSERIYSGGEPKDDEAFAGIARLGVRTVVSVDGARPDVEAAARHGLRYVHIPIGYGGIADEAGKALARLAREAEGPFYIHCHHGRHRGPAAAAIACIAGGAADGKSALAILERAGTSKGYAGLWRDVQSYEPPADGDVLPELASVAEVESVAAAMAQIDRASDNLKLCRDAGWHTPPAHPDVAAAQEALLLKEGFREIVRQLEEANDYDEQFAAWMQESEAAATALEAALLAQDPVRALQEFNAVQGLCKHCHADYRG